MFVHSSESVVFMFFPSGGAKDIKSKYDIDPREVGHGHYGIVRKAR